MMEEDEYLEDDVPIGQPVPIPEQKEPEQPKLIERGSEAAVKLESVPLIQTNGRIETSGTPKSTNETLHDETSLTSKTSILNTSASEASLQTTGSFKRSGRQKITRARKGVVKSIIIGAPTSTMSMDNVYSEPVGSGWARCYPRYKVLSEELAFSPIDSHDLAKVQASAMKMFDVLSKQKEKRGSKMRPIVDEESVERSLSPDKKRKSFSRGASEIRTGSIDVPGPSKRSISREKSVTPLVTKKESSEHPKVREETKEERKERKKMAKEAKELKKEERRLAEEKSVKEAEEKRRRKEEKERAKKEKEPAVTAVDITGWDTDKIAAHFGLKKVVLQITSLTQEAIDAALAWKPERRRSPERSRKSPPSKRARIQSESLSPSPDPRSERHLLTTSLEPEETDSHHYSQHLLKSPSPINNENDNDVRKRSKTVLRKCVNCLRELHMCVDQWYSQLGTESQYCSTDCIEEFVEKVKAKSCYDSNMKVPMLGTNNIIRRDLEAPTLEQLAQYIRQSSSFIPLCMSEKAEELEKKEKEARANSTKKASKFMSKESDILRQNLRVKLGQELFTSGRLIEKKGMSECKTKGADIEKELFRLCKDCHHSKYKHFSDNLRLLFIQFRNFASKVNTGVISVSKLCSIDPEELTDFCRNNNVSLHDNEEIDAVAPAKPLNLPTVTPEALAANQEISKHITTAPPVKMGRIPKKPKQAVSALDALLGDGHVDTTSQHNSHFYDANCSICAGKAKAKADREKKDMEEREKFREEEKLRKEKLLNYNDRKDGKRGDLKRFEVDRRRQRRDRSRSRSPLNPKDPLGIRNTSPGHGDDDDYAGGEDNSSTSPVWSAPPSKLSKKSRHEKKIDESWRTWVADDEVWRGNLHMGSVTFVTSLRAISNAAAFNMRDNADLSANLHVKGRIKELIVFEYLGGLRKSEQWDVITLVVEKPLDMERERKFNTFYQDMVSKERYEALNFVNHPRIKEAYLIPIRPNEEAPAVLLPWKGPGIPEIHGEMILFVAVRSRHGPINASEEKEEDTSKQASESETQEPSSSAVPVVDSHLAVSGLTEETKTVLTSRTTEAEPVGDFLIDPKFFEALKAKAPPAPKNPEDLSTLSDILQYINSMDNPKMISKVLHEVFQDQSLTESEKDIIKIAVQNKIAEKKRKREIEKAGFVTTQLVQPENVPAQDEYAPDQPNEPEDEEAQENDSTAGNEADDNSRSMSPSDFDMNHPTSFVGMGDVLAQLAPPPLPPVPPIFASSSPSENSNFGLAPPPQPPSSFLPQPPQAPPLPATFGSHIPQIPLPMAPNARSELMNIPPPAFNFARPGEISILAFHPQDASETNSVEATIGEDSPPDEEDLGPRGIPTIGVPPPPPTAQFGIPPPPMGMPHYPMLSEGLQQGMAPPNISVPPPMFHSPPKPLELHGSAGFRGLAPSLGGAGIAPNSSIDYFNMATSTSTFKPNEPGSGVAVPVVALPAGTLASNKNRGTAPGFGRAKPDNTSNDNIPRTPTPPPIPRAGARPGVRPGVRPGAGLVKRVAPGARLPVCPAPTPEELEIMEREERRRKRAIEREEENERKRKEAGEERGTRRPAKLKKLAKNCSLPVLQERIYLVSKKQGISLKGAEKIVRTEHMKVGDEESSSDSEEDLAASRGLMTVRVKQKPSKGGFYSKVLGYAYEHSTGSIKVARQRRALNVDYDEEGNEIVPDDAPSSDEDSKPSPAKEKSSEIPVPKKTLPQAPVPPPAPIPAPMYKNNLTPKISNDPKPHLPVETSSDMDIATDEYPNESNGTFDQTPWNQQKTMSGPQQFFNRGPPVNTPPMNNWSATNERPPGPSSSNHFNNQYDPHLEDGYGYPQNPPRVPPPPQNNFAYRGRGQPPPFRGRGPPPNFNTAPNGPPPFRGRGGPPPRHGGPPPLIPNGPRAHPYYDRGGHNQSPGPWNGSPRGGGHQRGHPPSGHENFSKFRGGPPPKAPPLAVPPFNGNSKPPGQNLLLSPPPLPPLPPSKW